MLQDLVGSGRALLRNVYSSQPEYENTIEFCELLQGVTGRVIKFISI